MRIGTDTAKRLSQTGISDDSGVAILISAGCPCGHSFGWHRPTALDVINDLIVHGRERHGEVES